MSQVPRDLVELEEFNDLVKSEDISERSSRPRDGTVAEYPSLVPATDRNTNDFNSQMWAVYGGNRFSPCEYSERSLPPGQYTVEYNDNIGMHFRLTNANLDDLLHLPDSASEVVINEVKAFWNKEQHFRKFGFLWKRGILLWGPAGSGKTSTIQLISQFVVQEQGIVLYLTDPRMVVKGLQLLRQIEPTRPIVILLEDVDTIIQDHGESQLLALLDGELQIDNVMFIATTNYPERLDKRLVNRPSRFDLVKKIGMPGDEARELYIKSKNKKFEDPNNEFELKRWVKETKGFSVAHIKELIVSVDVFEVPFEQAVARLRKMIDVTVSSDQNEDRNFGFLSN